MRQVLGMSRYLIILAVVGCFILSAIVQVGGLLRVAVTIPELYHQFQADESVSKQLIIIAVSVIDLFLVGTVLFIVAAGLYQLFVDPGLPLPGWLNVRTLDDLKSRVIGVIIVALLVSFLGHDLEEPDAQTILFEGIAIAAVIVAATFALRALDRPGAEGQRPGEADGD